MEIKSITFASAQYPIDFFSNLQEWQTKIKKWVGEAALRQAKYLLFPEYGAMELTSLLDKDARQDLKSQACELKKFLPTFIQTFQELAQIHKIYIIAPSIPVFHSEILTTNRVFVFSPSGQHDFQDKFEMTRFEDEEWNVQAGEKIIKVFETPDLKFAIATCFDVEFAYPGIAAAQAGAEVLFAPSCTETLKGAHRVHIGARARALENQMYVIVSQVIGEATWSPAVDINNGFAAFYATPDVGFPDDGIIKKGEWNHPGWIIQDLRISHLKRVRTQGAVLNFKRHQALQLQHVGVLKSAHISF